MIIICELVSLFIEDVNDMQSWANSFNYSLIELLKFKMAVNDDIQHVKMIKNPQDMFINYPHFYYMYVNKYPLYHTIRFNNVMDFRLKAKILLYLDGDKNYEQFYKIYLENYHQKTYSIRMPDLKLNMFKIYDRTINNDKVVGNLKFRSNMGKTIVETTNQIVVCTIDLYEGMVNYIKNKYHMDWVQVLDYPFILDI